MKNGFKFKLGNIFCFLSLLFLVVFYSCRTSKNSIFKEKLSIEKSDFKINIIDSIAEVVKDTKIKEFDSRNWIEVSNNFDFTFDGESNEDEFEVIKTDNGYKFKGKGAAIYKGLEINKDSTKLKENSSFKNALSNLKANSKLEHLSKESQSKIDKSKKNKSIGFNWNFIFVIIVCVVVALVLFWKFGLPKLKSK